MRPKVSLRRALIDPKLMGGILGGDSWLAWRALLLAAVGEKLEPNELDIFAEFTGRDTPPEERIDELWCVIGRRGGKSQAIACLAVWLAALCDWRHLLSPGEHGSVLLLAADIRQAKLLLDYALGAIEQTPMMAQTLVNRTADILTLRNRIRLEVRSASFRRIRGMTAVAVLCDEIAFWHSEDSANPDAEILAAARPALATTRGPLIAISSPYARRGQLWETYRKHYGADGDPGILVAKAATRDFNPSLPQSVIDRAMERDEAAARAEYHAEFRTDLEALIPRENVEACVSLGVKERAADLRHNYIAFCDPSGGSSDSMTMAIAHQEGKTVILDAIRERRPPFSPEAVVEEFCSLMKSYKISKVWGDRYAGSWVGEQFTKRGAFYEICEKTKSALYQDMLPALNSRTLDLLDDQRLINQLSGLKRRTSRGGRDVIDHSPGSHDDVANAVAGVAVMAVTDTGVSAAQRRRDTEKIRSHYEQCGRRFMRA